jgi:hypothetical protein
MTILLIKLREWYIHIFKKKILIVEKNKKFISNKFIIFLLNLFYFFLIKNLLKINKINMIYELDGIIFYDDNNIHEIKINQIMIEFNIINPKIKNSIKDFTDKINKYSKAIPFYIIVEIEKINIDFNIQIKLLSMGKIIIKEFQIKNILNKKLYELTI